ncbi:MAG: ATP-binding protein [Verrucomicrobia bacterium]|nr:ATP-binding protein [Verrucomicrobiota bacterium]
MKAFQQDYEVGASKRLIFPLITEACVVIREQGVRSEKVEFFRLALEELLMNVCHHSGLAEDDLIQIEVELQGGFLRLRVSDQGVAFDPVAATAPDISLSHDDRSIGGLGIYLIRKTSSDFLYRRVDEKNIVDVAWAVDLTE